MEITNENEKQAPLSRKNSAPNGTEPTETTSSKTAHSCGVVILFFMRLNCQFTLPQTDNQGRIIVTDITIDDKTLYLVNIYAPRTNTERQLFYLS